MSVSVSVAMRMTMIPIAPATSVSVFLFIPMLMPMPMLMHLPQRLVRARPQEPVEERARPALHQLRQAGFGGPPFRARGAALGEGGGGGGRGALREVLAVLPGDVHGRRAQARAAGLEGEGFGEHGVVEVGVGAEGEFDEDGAGLGGGAGTGDVDAAQGGAEEVRVFGRDVFVEGERGGGLFEGEGPEVADLRGEGVAAREEGCLAERGFADWRGGEC